MPLTDTPQVPQVTCDPNSILSFASEQGQLSTLAE